MIDLSCIPSDETLRSRMARLWRVSGQKICAIDRGMAGTGAPVHTVQGQYRSRGWTEWTDGFRIGSSLLQFDATGEEEFLEDGRRQTLARIPAHVTHFGVHDHGFTVVSTFGNLLRLMTEGRIPDELWERSCYNIALRCSGAVQARRWTPVLKGGGYIYSFNGPHSLFADTVRSVRSLVIAHILGGGLSEDQDRRVSLLERAIAHARTTARYNVYYGEGRDGYDTRGRVAHESLFNVGTGSYRCASTQQGYAPFTTWTRGLAWIICGYAELLEYFSDLSEEEAVPLGGHQELVDLCIKPLRATCDYYLEHTPSCGVPYWDTGAPGLRDLGDYLDRPADPCNDCEPVDSSAAAIAAQGLLRFGLYLGTDGPGARYLQAGKCIAGTLFSAPYLCEDPGHHGLILHSIYHWPNRWDHVPQGRVVACGEATMWGDYHARELAVCLQRVLDRGTLPMFFNVK